MTAFNIQFYLYLYNFSRLGSVLLKLVLNLWLWDNLKRILRSLLENGIFIAVLFFFVNWRKSSQNVVDEVLNSGTDNLLHESLICVDVVVEHVGDPVAHELADLVVQKKTSNFKLKHDAQIFVYLETFTVPLRCQ